MNRYLQPQRFGESDRQSPHRGVHGCAFGTAFDIEDDFDWDHFTAFIPQLLDRFRTEAEDILMMARMQLGVVRTTSRRLPRTRRKFLIDLPGRLAERQSEEIPYRDGTM